MATTVQDPYAVCGIPYIFIYKYKIGSIAYLYTFGSMLANECNDRTTHRNTLTYWSLTWTCLITSGSFAMKKELITSRLCETATKPAQVPLVACWYTRWVTQWIKKLTEQLHCPLPLPCFAARWERGDVDDQISLQRPLRHVAEELQGLLPLATWTRPRQRWVRENTRKERMDILSYLYKHGGTGFRMSNLCTSTHCNP